MRVTFKKDFDFEPAALRGMVTKAFRAGTTRTVIKECADAAIKAGAAELVKEPVEPTANLQAPPAKSEGKPSGGRG